MKKILFISIVSFAMACSNSKQNNSHDTIQGDSINKQAQAANYICPMGKECGFSDKPGKCNSCGMELVDASTH